MQAFGIILATAFGAIFGSYATLFAYRLPRGESCFGRYFGKKSRCPNCDTIIKTRDLIPLINWIMTLGRCRKCKIKIPRIHLFVELATTIVFVTCYLKFNFSEEFILYALTGTCLVILLACDFTHRVFPQPILILIATIIVALRASSEGTILNMINSGAIGIICATIFYHIFYKIGKFFSDDKQCFDYIKFLLAASLALTISQLLFYFFAVMLLFSMILLLRMAQRKMPFGFILIIPFIQILIN